MHLRAQPPIFVPPQFMGEIEKFSKAALMDMVWDLATRCAGEDSFNHPAIMDEIRHTGDVVTAYRKQEKGRNP